MPPLLFLGGRREKWHELLVQVLDKGFGVLRCFRFRVQGTGVLGFRFYTGSKNLLVQFLDLIKKVP